MAGLLLFLGAGASFECGLPLGVNLLLEIHQQASQPGNAHPIRQIGHERQWDPPAEEQLKIIRADAWNSGFTSIDRFVKERPAVAPAAKVLLARVLRDAEYRSKVDRGNGWYDYFWSRASDSIREGREAVKVITLNYDRTLEEYLIRRSLSAFGWNRDRARRAQETAVSILHLHGSLGALDEVEYMRSTATDPWSDAARAAERIVTLGEDIPTAYIEAGNLLRRADVIAFLGTSFPSEVMDNLFLDVENWKRVRKGREERGMEHAHVYSSTKDVRAGEWTRTRSRYLRHLSDLVLPHVTEDHDCLATLRNFTILP